MPPRKAASAPSAPRHDVMTLCAAISRGLSRHGMTSPRRPTVGYMAVPFLPFGPQERKATRPFFHQPSALTSSSWSSRQAPRQHIMGLDVEANGLAALSGTFLLLTTGTVVLRFVARYKQKGRVWMDDYTMALAWVSRRPML